jgi:uncharacterized membrane protein YeaQ/YmgE (transglycosylase-associated protein family)
MAQSTAAAGLTGAMIGYEGDGRIVRSPRTQEVPVLGFIIVLIIVGAIAGFIARAVVPGPDPMGVVGTIVLGIVGSFVGGFLGYVIFHKDAGGGFLQPAGIIGSVIGAIIVLLVYLRAGRRHGARV